MLKGIDRTTGFFTEASGISASILYSVLAVAAVLILLLSFLSGKIPASLAPQGKRIPLAAASLLFSASLFYDALSSYIPSTDSGATLVQNVSSLSLLHHAQAVLAFLSCCYLLIFSISYLTGKSYHKKLKLLSLTPLVWAIICVIERITVIISIMRVSELFLEIASLVFLMLFFMSFARVASEVNCKGSMWSVLACGSISAMLILTYSIPRIMLVLTGNEDSLVIGYPLNFALICAAIFILTFAVTTLRKGYTIEDVEKMQTLLEAEQSKAEEEVQAAQQSDDAICLDSEGNAVFNREENNSVENDTEASE